MDYAKPFLTYAELRATLERRGMEMKDRKDVERELRRIGYFRLGAYTYPFREMLPATSVPETSKQFRGDGFIPGSKFDYVMALYKYDSGLRRICLDGLQDLEVGVRAATAHVLSRRSPFAHLDAQYLDSAACQSSDTGSKTNRTKFEAWIDVYEASRKDSKDEDFVAHHLVKYGNDIHLWATSETLTFGGVVRLFNLLKIDDKNAVAAYFGVSDGNRFHKWLLALNGLRNVCAHHHRLWNRQLTYEIKVVAGVVTADLHHVAALGNSKKLYHTLALLAYLLRQRDGGAQWHLTFKTYVRKFPKIPLLGPDGTSPLVSMEYSMGFPPGWENLPLWQLQP